MYTAKNWLPLVLILSVSTAVHAEEKEEDNDPSDVTRPQTFLKFESGAKGKDADARLQLNISGKYSESIGYLAVLEGHFGTNVDAKAEDNKSSGFGMSKIRGRYFQVHDTGFSLLPKLGFSIDYIKNGNDWVAKSSGTKDTVAVGVVANMATPFDNWKSFPNVTAMENNYDNGRSGKGWQANWFNSVYIGDKGHHFSINPQYSNYDNEIGKNEQLLQMEFKAVMPLYSDKFWGSVTYSEFFLNSAADSRMKHLDGNQEIRLGVNWFF